MSDITHIKATETLVRETIVLTCCSSDSAKINKCNVRTVSEQHKEGSNTKWQGWHWISRASVKGHFYPSGGRLRVMNIFTTIYSLPCGMLVILGHSLLSGHCRQELGEGRLLGVACRWWQ